MPLPYDLNSITKEHIDALVGTEEGYLLEFKERVVLADERLKDEFSADISSLANEMGGDLIVGVAETRRENNQTTGVAGEIRGIERLEADNLDRTVNDVLRSRTDPRVQVRTRTVEIGDDKVILVIRVPRSPNAPHAVRNIARDEHTLRFYGRNRTGKYSLNVSQIRDRFVAGEALEKRIGEIVNTRIGQIVRRPPVRLWRTYFVALHIVPHASLLREGLIDTRAVLENPTGFGPNETDVSVRQRMHFDGCLLDGGGNNEGSLSYALVMRNGVVELVILDGFAGHNGDRGVIMVIRASYQARRIFDYVKRSCQALNRHGLEPPYYVQTTLYEVENFYLAEAVRDFFNDPVPIDRPRLDLPLIELEEVPDSLNSVARKMRPILEAWMNAGGRDERSCYTDEGDWRHD